MPRKQLGKVDEDLLDRVDIQAHLLGQTRRIYVEWALVATLENTEQIKALRAVASMSLPVEGGNEDPYCPFCAGWAPDAAHADDCAIVLACRALGRPPPWHDVDGRRCS